ncbi:MAG: hypothetical protein FJ125_18515, partial [Deltaproteobacteria bacterium]|nr:hypothetical protein [Deltaproteobacteria bacterium]
MSQQKPGSSDVQDLRARLGLKSQPAKADTAPSAPAPPPVQPAPTPAAPGVRHSPWPASRAAEGPGSNALLSRLMGPAAMPTPAVGSPPVLQPSPVPASVPYPSPAPLRPPPLDMDTEEETTGPGQPSPGLSTLPPPNMDPLAFLQQAPAVRRPSGVPVSAVVAPPPAGEYVPTPPPPQAPPPADPFASPWSGGLPRIPAPYPGHAQLAPQPLVAPEHMLGPGVGEVSMVTMSPGAKRRWLTTIAIALVLGLVGLGLGYVFGQIGKDRQIVNKRIDDATSVLASVEKTVALIKGIAPQIAKLSPEQPDYAQAEKMKTFSCRLALEEIIGDNLLLGRLITPDLVRYSAMANDFQDKVRRHGQL